MRLRLRVILFFVVGAMTGFRRLEAQNWFQASSPSARCCMGIAFDGSSTLLFGGVQGYYTPLGDTWKLKKGGWIKLAPANFPLPSEGPGMAYDAATGTVVMFGGSATLFGSCCGDLNETWIWDGTTWSSRQPAYSGNYLSSLSTLPPRRLVFRPTQESAVFESIISISQVRRTP